MARRLKAPGITLVAVFALSVVAAQAASAHTFVSESGANISVQGFNNFGTKDKFTVTSILGPATVECNKAAFAGSIVSGSETATVHPTYTECEFLGSKATVTTENEITGVQCDLVFHGATTVEMADVAVACEGTAKIEIDVPGICKLVIGSQSFLNGVRYTNVAGPPMTVGVEATVASIVFTKTTPSSGANNCSLIISSIGEYNSTDTVEGVGTGVTVIP